MNETPTRAIEAAVIRDIRMSTHDLRISLTGLKNVPGAAAEIFSALAKQGININLIVQNMTEKGEDWSSLSFTIASADLKAARLALDDVKSRGLINEYHLHDDEDILVMEGDGMQTHTDIAARIFQRLGAARINIEMICTSELEISCAVNTATSQVSLEMLREEFKDEIASD